MTFTKKQSSYLSSLGAFLTKWGTLVTILGLVIFFTIMTYNKDFDIYPFIQPSNIVHVFRSISIVTVIAIAITISLTVDGLDLSVGSMATFADSIVISAFVWYEYGLWAAILFTLFGAVLVGLANAFLIVKLRIPDLLATLSMLFIVEGVALTYTGGGSISEGMPRLDGTPTVGKLTPVFKDIGLVPMIIVIMVVVVILTHIFLTYTKHGRYMYVVGGNKEAARLSGIAVDKYRTLAYVLSALIAGIGGIMLASKVGSSQVNAGAGYLMPAVAAAYIGFSFGGNGKPNAIGTLVGSILMGILDNGLVMMSVPYYSVNIFKGGVLAIALASNYLRKK
ncbi:MAG TPA: ABC transporter permease [Anaerolineales bacterium]|nr:ABC transporter permease [Anaerolineales bacterium]